MRIVLSWLLFVLSCPIFAKDVAWLELAPQEQVLARTVVNTACPSILIDGKTSTMNSRVGADAANKNSPPAGQRLVCEKNVTGAKRIEIGDTVLKMPSKTPQRILVLGDTGCRIKNESAIAGSAVATQDDDDHGEKIKVQDCNDTKQWPFKTIAAAAAATHPDLIIHVGDYIYRESPCPATDKKECGGSPSGDQWKTWNADFFIPALPLLEAAPWIFVRGNHEICSRNGKGWFYYLDTGTYAKNGQCVDYSPPYKVKAGAFEALVFDSSSAADSTPPAKDVKEFIRQFQLAAAEKNTHAWLLSHRPIWGLKAGEKGQRDELQKLNATLQQAWETAPVPGVDLIVSGHTHLFELLGFGAALPPQAIIGNGGTDLAHKIKSKLAGQKIGNAMVANGNSLDDFGFALITADGEGKWSLRLHDTKGKESLRCAIAAGSTKCEDK